MNKNLESYLVDISWNESGASKENIQDLQSKLDFRLPEDYIELMEEFNGGEGEVGESSWLCLFPTEDLLTVNKDYELLLKQIPDFFMFGKDAADTGFAFHKEKGTVHSFGLMSDFETDPIDFCGNSFTEFIEYLYKQ